MLALENIGYQIALTEFRISSHNLRIETGRHDNPKLKLNERLFLAISK